MITFNNENLLSEGLTDVVYHFTSLTGLKNILKTNMFYTSPALRSSDEERINRDRLFFFSTTRSKSEGFFKEEPGSVRIKLDGQKLSQKYKGYAIDYFGVRKNKKWSPELEDRIVLDKPYIDNATKYILELSILVDYKKKISLKNIIELCERENIPIFVYGNVEDFAMNLKRHALSNETIFSTEHENDFGKSEIMILALLSFDNIKLLDNYNEKIRSDVINEFTKVRSYSIDEVRNSIRSISHKRNITILEAIVKDMKKMKTKTLSEYIKSKYKND